MIRSVVQWVLVAALVVASFFIGKLTTQVQYLQKGAPTPTGAAQQQQAAPTVTLSTIKGLFSKNIIKFGDANKKLLLVEVVDPSCPFCHIASGKDPELNQSAGAQFRLVSQGGSYVAPVEEFKKLVDGGQASFAFIYDPGHGNGEMGMKALYCAFDKGKFWEAHDLLMSEKGYEIQNGYDATQAPATGPVVKNDKTKSQDMATFLSSAVDPAFMKSCLDSGKYDSRLGSDTQLATSLGVSGTPGFFINASSFPGAYSYTDMKSAVDAALK